MHNPRSLLLLAFLLDWLGQLLILVFMLLMPALIGTSFGIASLREQFPWLMFQFLLYPLLGWLFGSYTVLRWRRLSLTILLQRLLITAAATLSVVAITRWCISPSDSVWLVSRRVQFFWIGALTIWVFALRLGLRGGFLLPESQRILLLADPMDLHTLLSAWNRVPHSQTLQPVEPLSLFQQLNHVDESISVVLSQSVRNDSSYRPLLSGLAMCDPRQVRVLSFLSLFEIQQERLPPFLITDTLISYSDLPWAATFSVQAQLKRMADLLLAALLLLLTSPFVLFASLLIWLEDGGPVLYAQQRTGWLGRRFTIYKLRTMSVQPHDAPASWTLPGDHRITSVGSWLRRFRLDELPQLFNVLNGEMSLIGPRPERPELEDELEQRIPHYRKRHWMRPGLSGWAQVCAPYASSIQDSDLKLSYDLYYLVHFNTWLDLVILFRTVKIVLKAGGR